MLVNITMEILQWIWRARMDSENEMKEKERTCPSCRTPISILASKCKFCGEVVGKPKSETRQLSVNDLGGESVHHRALSSSVMDALESFRIEDEQDATAGSGFTGLDELDSPNEESAFDKYDQTVAIRAGATMGASAGSRIALVGKIAVGLIIVGVLAVKVPGYLKSTMDTEADAMVPVYVNRVPDIIASNGEAIDALAAAIDATQQDASPENSKIADDMLERVNMEIKALLNDPDWDTSKLKDASELSARAVNLYPTGSSTDLKNEVDQENIDYRMFLTKIDPKTNTVEFQLSTSGSPKVQAKHGDVIADRFRLISVSGRTSVKLEDIKRNNRLLECKVAGSPK
jgi:hypothetical protein